MSVMIFFSASNNNFFCRNDVQAIDFLRKGGYAPDMYFIFIISESQFFPFLVLYIFNECLKKKYIFFLGGNKIVMKCPEKYIKAYIFFFINQLIEFKFENVKYISIYLTNI